jgi:hypothetical protein
MRGVGSTQLVDFASLTMRTILRFEGLVVQNRVQKRQGDDKEGAECSNGVRGWFEMDTFKPMKPVRYQYRCDKSGLLHQWSAMVNSEDNVKKVNEGKFEVPCSDCGGNHRLFAVTRNSSLKTRHWSTKVILAIAWHGLLY